jgi:hypothetical protein
MRPWFVEMDGIIAPGRFANHFGFGMQVCVFVKAENRGSSALAAEGLRREN